MRFMPDLGRTAGRKPMAAPSEPGKQEQWQRLFQHLLGYQATWVVDVGLKSGLLRTIRDMAGAEAQERQVAAALSLDERYTGVWCRAAYAFGLLDWDETTGYRLAPHIAELLLEPSDPRYLGGRMQFTAALYEDFKAFPAYLRSGGTWPRSEHDPALLETIRAMTKPDAVMIVNEVLPRAWDAVSRLREGGTILDVGAGAGFAALLYAERFPATSVVGLEFDQSMADMARAAVAEAGMSDRVEIRQADANALEGSDAYRLVTMNVALHETGGPNEWRNVLKRVHRALEPGGTLVVSEMPYPDSVRAYREQPVYQALTGTQFHESLVGCGAITQGTLANLIAEAGFNDAQAIDQPIATRFVMIARKAQ